MREQVNQIDTVELGYGLDENLWESFHRLEQTLGNVQDIPFNTLRIVVTEFNVVCNEGADMSPLINLFTLPLKFLSVYEEGGIESCAGPVASTILELICLNSSLLEEFEIRCNSDNVGLFKGWEPTYQFDKLETLSIAEDSSVAGECLQQIILGAPNLKAIYNNCLYMIRGNLIPENMYRTLKRLVFALEDIQLVEKFADRLDHLEELVVKQEGGWIRPNLSNNEAANKRRFVRLCQKLLGLNVRTLHSYGISCEDQTVFSQLVRPLPSLQTLYLAMYNVPEDLDKILGINFASFPKLRKVLIREEGLPDLDRGNDIICYAGFPKVSKKASKTTLELFVDGSIHFSNFSELRQLFPNLIKLSIKCKHTPHVGCIANLWPNLQTLGITVEKLEASQLGAEVLGLKSMQLRPSLEFHRHSLEAVSRWRCTQGDLLATYTRLRQFDLEYLQLVGGELGRVLFEEVEHLLRQERQQGLKYEMRPHLLTESSWNIHRFGDLYEDFCDPSDVLFNGR